MIKFYKKKISTESNTYGTLMLFIFDSLIVIKLQLHTYSKSTAKVEVF